MNAIPQFSVKDILWLMTLLGIGVGWYLDHRAAKVREQDGGDALSSIDIGLQVHTHYLKENQQKLDGLKREGQTDDES